MSDRLEQLNDKLRGVKLTAAEKADVRQALEWATLRTEAKRPPVRRRGFRLWGRPVTAAVLASAMLFVGAGVSYAAEDAVPGDTLYPIKVQVNEEVRQFLAFSRAAKARWQAQRAERRLAEAERLAGRGHLNEEQAAKLQAAFQKHADLVRQRLDEIEEQGGQGEAAAIGAEFQGVLAGHKTMMAGFRPQPLPPQGCPVCGLHEAVGQAKAKAAAHQAEMMERLSAQPASAVQRAVEQRTRLTKQQLEKLRQELTKRGALTDRAAAELAAAEQDLADGQTAMDQGDQREALRLYQQVHQHLWQAKLADGAEGPVGPPRPRRPEFRK